MGAPDAGGTGTTASDELAGLGGLEHGLGSGATDESSVHEGASLCSGAWSLRRCAVVSRGAIMSCGLRKDAIAAEVTMAVTAALQDDHLSVCTRP